MDTSTFTIAILYPADRAAVSGASSFASRFGALTDALRAGGFRVEPTAYQDDIAGEVEATLARVQLVLVWHNPSEGGRTREVLDDMLRRVAARGVIVSAHPDTILRMGTKDVLVAVRDLPFGSDCYRVESLQQLAAELPQRLSQGPRVLKQYRGHSGIGVWRVEQIAADSFALRHAQRGSLPEEVPFRRVVESLAPYFTHGGHMIDQAWQPRLHEGMVRAYLVRDRVAGFGHQAINALYPASAGDAAPQPGPRSYSGPDDARFQRLRQLLEEHWVQLLRKRLEVSPERLPLLWDADFLLGGAEGAVDTHYVLCEINVSSVSPYPESANEPLLDAVRAIASERPAHAP